MTDDEFEVLDELYFVEPFSRLADLTGREEEDLIPIVRSLYQKGWIRIMKTVDDELRPEEVDFMKSREYYFLATKSGLLAHNS